MKCLRPRVLHKKDGSTITTICGRCRVCDADRQRMWCGRVLAEAQHCVGASSVTLTYGHDLRIGKVAHPHATRLVFADVQKLLKRIRRRGYPCRYYCAGEYGGDRGRAHWHLIILWLEKTPEFVYNQGPRHDYRKVKPPSDPDAVRIEQTWSERDKKYRCWNDPFWRQAVWEYDEKKNREVRRFKPIGVTNYQPLDLRAVMYATKYATKARGEDAYRRESMTRMSKKPLLGYKHFDALAKLHVEHGQAPKRRLYTVPGVGNRKTGEEWRYVMSDSAVKYFCQSFIDQWAELRPGEPEPQSDFVNDYWQKRPVPGLPAERPLSSEKFRRVERPRWYPDGRFWKPHETNMVYPFQFDEKLNTYVVDDPDRGRLYWSYAPNGLRDWAPTIISPSEAGRLLEEDRKDDPAYILARVPKDELRPRFLQNRHGFTSWIRLGKAVKGPVIRAFAGIPKGPP